MGWTKWAKRYLTHVLGAVNDNSGQIGSHFGLQIKDVSGTMRNVYLNTSNNRFNGFCFVSYGSGSPQSTYEYCTVAIGSGSTAETEEDYCIESRITSTILKPYFETAVSTNLCFAQMIDAGYDEEGKFSNYIKVQGTNTTDSDISISEFALYERFRFSTDNDGTANVCFYRKVLDTPIVVSPGGTYSFKIRISE